MFSDLYEKLKMLDFKTYSIKIIEHPLCKAKPGDYPFKANLFPQM